MFDITKNDVWQSFRSTCLKLSEFPGKNMKKCHFLRVFNVPVGTEFRKVIDFVDIPAFGNVTLDQSTGAKHICFFKKIYQKIVLHIEVSNNTAFHGKDTF